MITQNSDIQSTQGGAKLKKCPKCLCYTLKPTCTKCKTETKSPNYKFIQIRDAPPRSAPFKRR